MPSHPSPAKIDTRCSFLLRNIGGSLKTNCLNLKFPARWAVLRRERTCSRNQKHVEIKQKLQLNLPLRETDRMKQSYVVPLSYTDNRGIFLPPLSALASLPFFPSWKSWSRAPNLISAWMRTGECESKPSSSESISYETLHKLKALAWDLH